MTDLTQERLAELFEYDEETGDLIWRNRPREMFTKGHKGGETAWRTWNSKHAGTPVRNQDQSGYCRATINGRKHFAHRLIWMLVHGDWPAEIDHINGIKSDNRLCNLRAADRQKNMRNLARRSDNTSGFTGVSYAKRDGVFIAYVTENGRARVIGRFNTAEEAAAAREAESTRLGFHPNHGRAA